jgi:hypothetical protein
MEIHTTGERDSRRSKGASIEIKTAAMIFVVLAVLFVVLRNLIGGHATVELAVTTVAAFLSITIILDILVYRPLHGLIARSRYRLGGKCAQADTSYRDEQVELGCLFDTLIDVLVSTESQETANASIRNDLVRLRTFNRQLVEVVEIGKEINAALPYREPWISLWRGARSSCAPTSSPFCYKTAKQTPSRSRAAWA